MGKGVEIFGGLFVFTFCVLLIPQMLSFAISYKVMNECTSRIVEVIEVHEGLTEESQLEISQFMQQYPQIQMEIKKSETSETWHSYDVSGKTGIEISLIGLKVPLTCSKSTKRVIY